MHWQLAWRNIWRNPRRTGVILTAVVIGVWSMLFLSALMRGIMFGMVDNGIATLTGHLKVVRAGYRADPTIENRITTPDAVADALGRVLPPEARWTARVRLDAVASNARHSSGVVLAGIDPAEEVGLSFIGRGVSGGRTLDPADAHGIVVGEALLATFETRLGNKLVLMSQDSGRDIASRAFRIVGTFRAEMQETEKRYVFVSRQAAQEMLAMGSTVSEFSVLLPRADDVDRVAADLRSALPPGDLEVYTWRDLLPILDVYLEIYDQFVFVWFLVVFIAMGFGIVNTTLMAVFERIKEFGLCKAMGMKPGRIVRQVLLEATILLLLGMAAGNALACGTTLLFVDAGIDLSAFAAGAEFAGMSRLIFPVFYIQDIVLANLMVLGLGLVVCLYPAVKAARITPVAALRQT